MNLDNELQLKKLLEDERHNFKVLFESNIALNSSKNLDELLHEVMNRMVTETLADRGCLILINEAGDIEIKVRHKMENFQEEMAKTPVLHHILEEVLKTGENSCVLDTSIDFRFRSLIDEGKNIHSIICLPLKHKDKVIGAIYVDSIGVHPTGMDFSSNKIELIEALASQAAVAIENTSLYEKLNDAHKKLLSIEELKRTFITLASHELRTPLTIIRGFMYILKREISPLIGERTVQMLYKIESNYNKLEKIVNDISSLARLSSDRTSMQREWRFLYAVINDIADDMRPFIKKRSQTLNVNIPSNLPRVYINYDQIHLAIFHLVQNAIRFTEDGGNITIFAENNDSKYVTIHVKDTGIGIPQSEFENIFQRFYEIQDVEYHKSAEDELEFKAGGIGLGLAIAKNIIETHGGEIWVRSEIDKGSDFIFTLLKEVP